MIHHATKSVPARPSIQSILLAIRDKSTSIHATGVRGHSLFGRIAPAAFPSPPIRTICVTPELDSRDAPSDPTRRRELPRRWPYPRGDRDDDARGNLFVPIRAPAWRRRTMWARSRAHRSEPCCGSHLFARAPAFGACERPYRPVSVMEPLLRREQTPSNANFESIRPQRFTKPIDPPTSEMAFHFIVHAIGAMHFQHQPM